MRRHLLLVSVVVMGCNHPARVAPATPTDVAATVLSADRAFSRNAATMPLPAAIGAMVTDGVLMPAPRGETLARRARVMAALAATADSTARASWVPIQVGLAAAGRPCRSM